MILNKNTKEDKNRKYTFTGGIGCKVIDYIREAGERKERRKQIKEDKIDSNHQSVEVIIREQKKKIKNKEREKSFGEVYEKRKKEKSLENVRKRRKVGKRDKDKKKRNRRKDKNSTKKTEIEKKEYRK